MSRAVHESPKKTAERAAKRQPRPAGSGWISFAGIYLVITGMLNLIWGITAHANKSYFAEEGLVWSNLKVWGSFAIVIALCQLGVGALLFARKVAGMLMAIVMAGIFVNFLYDQAPTRCGRSSRSRAARSSCGPSRSTRKSSPNEPLDAADRRQPRSPDPAVEHYRVAMTRQ